MMKKYVVSIIMMFSFLQCYAKDVECHKPTHEFAKGHCSTIFKVKVEEAGLYYIGAWVCPAILSDASYEEFSLQVNGKSFDESISFSKGDWQSKEINCVYLGQGENEISIVGGGTLFPNVSEIKVSRNKKEVEFSDKLYLAYKEKALAANPDKGNAIDTVSNRILKSWSSQSNPPYAYDYRLNIPCKYTFYTTAYFTRDQWISVYSYSLLSSHVLELFKVGDPSHGTWSQLSSSSSPGYNAMIHVQIPESGNYYVRVRSYYDSQSGVCNVNINSEYQYDNMPIYSVGMRSSQSSSYVNSFTCYSDGDPIMWIEKGSSAPGKIYGYNDDYHGTGDFSWGLNSRVYKNYSSNGVLLSAYSSSSPEFNCDLYANCASTTNFTDSNFPLLKQDDAIKAANATQAYNCISWTGGIYNDFVWPPSYFSGYGSTLSSFDAFYHMNRYPGSVSYYRTNDSNDCDIDLWYSSSSSEFTHASITKGSDSNCHGYAWESKMGSNQRLFHPRNALTGPLYGTATYHYKKIGSSGAAVSLEESIADGQCVIEYPAFSDAETEFITNKLKKIDPIQLLDFQSKYEKWDSICKSALQSNPNIIKKCKEYEELLSLCKHGDLKYYVYSKLGDGRYSAVWLIEDIDVKENMQLLEDVHKRNKENKYNTEGVFIYRGIISNAMSFVKSLISGREQSLMDDSQLASYSSDIDVKVVGQNQISINLIKESKVIVKVVSVENSRFLSEKEYDCAKGQNEFVLDKLAKGVNLIIVEVDGKYNVKKLLK